jgi:hypothetical protein
MIKNYPISFDLTTDTGKDSLIKMLIHQRTRKPVRKNPGLGNRFICRVPFSVSVYVGWLISG